MTKLCVNDRIKISILGGGRMVKSQKIVALLLLCAIVSSFFGCDSVNKHNELRCVEKRLGISLTSALLVDSYTDRGYDGSVCYHVFSVPEGFDNMLNSEWQDGEISAEALAICEESSYANGEKVINFPTVEGGVYYYDIFNDGENERVCLAVLDSESNILYYFFASGQAIQYPNDR